ncbi:hypothetical protein HY732_03120 [Candidatus Uhrbacteria bacterium]|nr:hypothetical protein [Candidatus Uhrbacteria bacterium]
MVKSGDPLPPSGDELAKEAQSNIRRIQKVFERGSPALSSFEREWPTIRIEISGCSTPLLGNDVSSDNREGYVRSTLNTLARLAAVAILEPPFAQSFGDDIRGVIAIRGAKEKGYIRLIMQMGKQTASVDFWDITLVENLESITHFLKRAFRAEKVRLAKRS